MRTSSRTGIALGFAASLALAGCSEPTATDGSPAPDSQSSSNASLLYEVGTLASFVEGNYAGQWDYTQVKSHGDFGLGTFDGIDGEMIAVDGAYYQVRVDGSVSEVQDSQTTPYAQVLFFRPQGEVAIGQKTKCFSSLDRLLDAQVVNPNSNVHTFKVTGSFPKISTRAIARQSEPYRPFDLVQPEQVEFDLENTSGTLVAIRTPDEGLTALAGPSYHYHFISTDRSTGGHVLSCTISDGVAEFDSPARMEVIFPTADSPGIVSSASPSAG